MLLVWNVVDFYKLLEFFLWMKYFINLINREFVFSNGFPYEYDFNSIPHWETPKKLASPSRLHFMDSYKLQLFYSVLNLELLNEPVASSTFLLLFFCAKICLRKGNIQFRLPYRAILCIVWDCCNDNIPCKSHTKNTKKYVLWKQNLQTFFSTFLIKICWICWIYWIRWNCYTFFIVLVRFASSEQVWRDIFAVSCFMNSN